MITVIGMGTGTPPPRITEATLVVGAPRHLKAATLPRTAERIALGPLPQALDQIEAHLTTSTDRHDAVDRPAANDETPAQARPAFEAGGAQRRQGGPGAKPPQRNATTNPPPDVVVLASGDPGFFGITRALATRFGPAALKIHPATPSIALAFARASLPWDDAVVVSAHGRDIRTAVNVCRAHPKTAVLTGPDAGPAELGAALARTNRTLIVGEALGTPAEKLHRLTPQEAAARDWSDGPVNVVLCLDESRSLARTQRTIAGAAERPARWALPEDDFAHRDSMITKFEVRALALARLGPRLGDLVWDIGAGSGSVAVECARLGAAAIAVERSPDEVARIRRNAAAHGIDVEAVEGEAPDALAALPDPDAVFIGGGGAALARITAASAARARRTVVVTLAALDRVPAVRRALTEAGMEVNGVQLQSSRLQPLPGDVTRLAATNPVFVLWGDHRDRADRDPADGRDPGDRASHPDPPPTHPAATHTTPTPTAPPPQGATP